MARQMPRLPAKFALEADEALELADAGEQIRAHSLPGTVARQLLTRHRLEALYETAFLRVFLRWENFLEESFLRYLCGYASHAGPATLRGNKFNSLSLASSMLLGTRDFVPWANPNIVIARSHTFIDHGLHEIVLSSSLSRLEAFNWIRNRVAHASDYARQRFDAATTILVGRRIPSSSPGRFLREPSTPNQLSTWLFTITQELKSLAAQIAP
jgi:hypothetical protein